MPIFLKIRKFSSLNRRQRSLFLEAYLTLGMMRAAVGLVPFSRLVNSMTKQDDAVAPALDCTRSRTARAIGEAVRTAATGTPWESACLVQALTAQRMLSRRDIGGIFYLGATMDRGSREMLMAHAWLQCDGQILTGEAGHERFKVLSTFRWD